MRKLLHIDLNELRCMTAGNWIYTGLQIENVPLYLAIEPAELEALTVVEDNSMALKTLTAKNPSEARGIRKALRAAGIKFEFKSAGKRRRKARRNPVRKRRSKASRERASLKKLQARARAILAPNYRLVKKRRRR